MGDEGPLQPDGPAKEQVSPMESENSEDDPISEDLDADVPTDLRDSTLFKEDYWNLNASMQIFYQDLTMQAAYKFADQTRQQLKLYLREISNLQIDLGDHQQHINKMVSDLAAINFNPEIGVGTNPDTAMRTEVGTNLIEQSKLISLVLADANWRRNWIDMMLQSTCGFWQLRKVTDRDARLPLPPGVIYRPERVSAPRAPATGAIAQPSAP